MRPTASPAFLALGAVALLLFGACDSPQSFTDAGLQDLSVTGGSDMTDMSSTALTSNLGAACKMDTDCTASSGKPTCFREYLFNSVFFLPAKDGYCSSFCQVDTDCGSQGSCIDFGQIGAFCFRKCHDKATCRHPGYICQIDADVCFPDNNFDCDPTQGDGTCQALADPDPNVPKIPGGCLRDAYEDKGHCSPICKIAIGSCKADPMGGVTRHCAFVDSTVDLKLNKTVDKWRGLICLPDQLPSVKDGNACKLFNDCREGSECDLYPGGDGRCHPLCVRGGAPACKAGTCQDTFRTGVSGVGLCE